MSEECVRCGADLQPDRETRHRVELTRERSGTEETVVAGPLCGTCNERVAKVLELRETES